MGLCHEFGAQIREGCGHPMQAGQTACGCPECGTVCHGLFEGCPDVWARGLPVRAPAKVDEVANGIVPARAQPVAVGNGRSSGRVSAELEAGPSRPAPDADYDLVGMETATRAAAQAETARRVAAQPAPARPEPDRPKTGDGAGGQGDVRVDAARAGNHDEAARRAAAQAEADRAASEDEANRRGAAASGDRRTTTTANGGPAALGAGPGTGTPPGDARTDVLRWFEDAFEGLRCDLRELVTGMTQQQAMIAELLDSRQADLRLVVVAEGLPDVVQDAVEAAVAEHTAEVVETLDSALGELRQGIKKTESASVAAVGKLRRTLEASERNADAAVEEVRRRQEEAEEREVARARALKASLTRQLKPLAEALDQVVERSDHRMEEINRRLDDLARPAPPVAAPARRAAPAKKAPAKKAAAGKSRATQAAAPKTATARKAPATRAAPAGHAQAPPDGAQASPLKRASRPGAARPEPQAAPGRLVARRQPLRGLRTLEER